MPITSTNVLRPLAERVIRNYLHAVNGAGLDWELTNEVTRAGKSNELILFPDPVPAVAEGYRKILAKKGITAKVDNGLIIDVRQPKFEEKLLALQASPEMKRAQREVIQRYLGIVAIHQSVTQDVDMALLQNHNAQVFANLQEALAQEAERHGAEVGWQGKETKRREGGKQARVNALS